MSEQITQVTVQIIRESDKAVATEVVVENDRTSFHATLWFPRSVVTVAGQSVTVPIGWWSRKTGEIRQKYGRNMGGIVIRAQLA